MTTSHEQDQPHGNARRLTVGALVCCGVVAATPASAFANHDAATAMDGMACPHAAAGSGPSAPGAAPDGPARGASIAPIAGPVSSSPAPKAPSSPPPAPRAKAAAPAVQARPAAPAVQAKAPVAAAQQPAQRAASAPATQVAARRTVATASTSGRASASRTPTARASAGEPSVRRASTTTARRKTAATSRTSRVRRAAPPAPTARYMKRVETPWTAPVVVRAPASVSAASPAPDGTPDLLVIGLGLLGLGGLAAGFVLLRRRGGGSAAPTGTSIQPSPPTTLDAFDLALYELIAEAPRSAAEREEQELTRPVS